VSGFGENLSGSKQEASGWERAVADQFLFTEADDAGSLTVPSDPLITLKYARKDPYRNRGGAALSWQSCPGASCCRGLLHAGSWLIAL